MSRARLCHGAMAVALLLRLPAGRAQSVPGPVPFSARERTLWAASITPYLEDSLWSSRSRYDAAHLLMVPLHAAFERGFDEGMRQYSTHFARFMAQAESVRFEPESELGWVHYLYLCSQFVVLAQSTGRNDLVPAGLPQRLHEWVEALWLTVPAWQWDRAPFAHGMRERVQWKLQTEDPGLSYYPLLRRIWRSLTGQQTPGYFRAIIDPEQFLFAIAADLRHRQRLAGTGPPGDSLLDDILTTARQVYEQRGTWTARGGWLFQPGVWADHSAYAYACRTEKRPGMEKCPVPGIAEDASHSHRMALWLRSLASAYPEGSAPSQYYEKARHSLERQFFEVVAVPPGPEFNGWRTRNFMDGHNGVYRWGYVTLGPDHGYGPYELSGTVLLGWWSFLGGPRVKALYSDLAARFPLSPQLLQLYSGPSTSRERDSTATETNFLTRGPAELICRLAAELP